MIRLSPGQLGERDWKTEVGQASVSFEDEEVSTALPLVSSLVLPDLPSKDLIGALEIAPLLEGYTREAVSSPELVRLEESEVEPD